MSEEDPFDDIDYILEYISENLSFDNEEQLNVFIKEFTARLKDFYNALETESDSTSSEESPKIEPEFINVNIDEEGFHSLK
jgi:hypothetical protein